MARTATINDLRENRVAQLKPQKILKPKYKVGERVCLQNDGEKVWYAAVEFAECTSDEVRYGLHGLTGMYPEARLLKRIK